MHEPFNYRLLMVNTYKLSTKIRKRQNDIESAIGNFHPKEVANGNYMLELALSEDGNYLALLLHQFTQLSYEPVTQMLTFEGNEAQTISKLF